MNNIRRKQLRHISEKLSELLSELEVLRDEEQEYYDNMPESLTESERGQKSYEAISNLDDAYGSLEESLSSIDNAVE